MFAVNLEKRFITNVRLDSIDALIVNNFKYSIPKKLIKDIKINLHSKKSDDLIKEVNLKKTSTKSYQMNNINNLKFILDYGML